MSKTAEKLEAEFKLAKEVGERLEKLKQEQPEYFKNREAIFTYIESLEKKFKVHLEAEQRFLEGLPAKIQEQIEKHKDVLKLRKDILEMMK